MLKRCLSCAILFSFISLLASPAIAKAKGTWEDVKNLVGQQIAVKDKSGRVTYGILRTADNILIKLQKAGKKSMTNAESSFPRVNVKKVWRATLFVTRRKTGKGALIGAGVGIGVGLV